ncbi:uncharacterized protein LOC129748341 [Uranotaenia lowii]|uniref:uncharacterized protein LOC129748341 n=1 Tax=Uranotaenia lowii TaxID=190385 RepID=UPI00247B1A82|nr:uncharacterized protein LOC129748341 [Uranotaenia lowii]XP_055598883.1 uncharacterized protein LOC129748341 [Uranotaenia lowii]
MPGGGFDLGPSSSSQPGRGATIYHHNQLLPQHHRHQQQQRHNLFLNNQATTQVLSSGDEEEDVDEASSSAIGTGSSSRIEPGSIIPDRTGRQPAFCRLCLTHSDTLKALFPQNALPDHILLTQIMDCVDVQITLPDDIKSFICVDCVQQIYSFASFKELCKSNDQLLKSQPFAHDDSEDEGDRNGSKKDVTTVHVTGPRAGSTSAASSTSNSEEKFIPDASLLEKLYEQGVQVEAIGQKPINLHQPIANGEGETDREAERKAKNAARMRRWRLRQRQKQDQKIVASTPEPIVRAVVEQKDPAQIEREEALRIKQAQEIFALLAQQQLRQVEAEIRRLKSSGNWQLPEPINDAAINVIKNEPIPLALPKQQQQQQQTDQGESSRQSSPTSESRLATIRRNRAEYMRKWRAKQSAKQQSANIAATFGFVGRPPVLSPAPGETEKLVIQRHNRAEYMRRWRRERLKQELSPEEFDDWSSKSEQRRRFREWQVLRESASSAGDDTMDCGDGDTERSYSFDGINGQS